MMRAGLAVQLCLLPLSALAQGMDADRAARLRARAAAVTACDGFAVPASVQPMARVPLNAPPGMGDAPRMVYETRNGLIPVLPMQGETGLEIFAPLHPDGAGGGEGYMHIGWIDAATGVSVTCAPRPMTIAAAVPPKGAWTGMIAALTEDVQALEAHRPGATGDGPGGATAQIADLEATYAEAPAEQRALLDIWAAEAGPKPDHPRLPPPSDKPTVIDAGPAPVPATRAFPTPDPAPTGNDALCPGSPESYLASLDALAWANAHNDAEVQQYYTAGTTLAGISAGLFGAMVSPKLGQRIENGVGAAAGLTNLLSNMVQGLVPGEVKRLDAALSVEELTEDTTDPVVHVLNPVLHLESKGWSTAKARLDLAIIGLQLQGQALPGGTAASKATQRLLGKSSDELLDAAQALRKSNPDLMNWKQIYATPVGREVADTLFDEAALGSLLKPLSAMLDNEIVNKAWDTGVGVGLDGKDSSIVRTTCRLADPQWKLMRHELLRPFGLEPLYAASNNTPYQAVRPAIATVHVRLREEVPIRLSKRPTLDLPMVIHPARLYPLRADGPVMAGESAEIHLDAQVLEHPARVRWEVSGGPPASVTELPVEPGRAAGVRIATAKDSDAPIHVRATLEGKTLRDSEPAVFSHVIHIGKVEAQALPKCGWVGAKARIELRVMPGGRLLDPAGYAWSVSPGGTLLAPGVIGITQSGPPLSVTATPTAGRDRTPIRTLVERDCACGRALFPGVKIDSQPFSPLATSLFGAEFFAIVGEGRWSVTGPGERSGVEPEMRLTLTTRQDEATGACRVVTAPTLARKGVVQTFVDKDVAAFTEDSLNIFGDALDFDILDPAPQRFESSFDADVPLRGSVLPVDYRGPGDLFVTRGGSGLSVTYSVDGTARPRVDRGWPTRRTNLGDTLEFHARYRASFTAYPEDPK